MGVAGGIDEMKRLSSRPVRELSPRASSSVFPSLLMELCEVMGRRLGRMQVYQFSRGFNKTRQDGMILNERESLDGSDGGKGFLSILDFTRLHAFSIL